MTVFIDWVPLFTLAGPASVCQNNGVLGIVMYVVS